jgi:hypothetical protein
MVFGRGANGRSQKVQHLVVHPDEANGRMVCAYLSLAAPDTLWRTAGGLDEQALRDADASSRRRGYGLRRVNAFQTRQGVRYAAIWQFGRPVAGRVQTGMDLATFRAAAERLADRGFAVSQLDAARTEGGARFSAVWEPAGETRQKVCADLTGEAVAHHVALHAADGLAPRLIAGRASSAGARFSVVFDAPSAGGFQTDLSLAASETTSRTRVMKAAGYELRDASGYVIDGEPFMTAVWEKS